MCDGWMSLSGDFISVASLRRGVILLCLSVESGVAMACGVCRTGLCYSVEKCVVLYLLE